jgi:hypothetical protein
VDWCVRLLHRKYYLLWNQPGSTHSIDTDVFLYRCDILRCRKKPQFMAAEAATRKTMSQALLGDGFGGGVYLKNFRSSFYTVSKVKHAQDTRT